MSVASTDVTVTTTATLLAQADKYPLAVVVVVESGGSTVTVGDATVTAGNGLDIAAGGSLDELVLKPGERLYGRVASGTTVAEVFTNRA